jgi:hypothetical protein
MIGISQEQMLAEMCVCGHRRDEHDYDADYDEGRWRSYWGVCEVCTCKAFEEEE